MRRLVKFALIILPIIIFYFWSYLGLGILGIILIIFRILTWKHEPKITKKEMNTEDDEINFFGNDVYCSGHAQYIPFNEE